MGGVHELGALRAPPFASGPISKHKCGKRETVPFSNTMRGNCKQSRFRAQRAGERGTGNGSVSKPAGRKTGNWKRFRFPTQQAGKRHLETEFVTCFVCNLKLLPICVFGCRIVVLCQYYENDRWDKPYVYNRGLKADSNKKHTPISSFLKIFNQNSAATHGAIHGSCQSRN